MTADFTSFVENPDGSDESDRKAGWTRGERLVGALGLDRSATIGQVMGLSPGLRNFWNSKALAQSRQLFGLTDDKTMASFVDDFLATTKKDDFIFHKEYKVVGTYTKVRGKWQSALTDSVFIDSTKVHKVYATMIAKRILQVFARQAALTTGLAQARAQAQLALARQFLERMLQAVEASKSQDYAMFCMLKGVDSPSQYVASSVWPHRAANLLMTNDVIRHELETEYEITALLAKAIKRVEPMQGFFNSFALLVLIIMILLAFIVSNSLMATSIEDKTYENAMLRTLGWSSTHIVFASVLKSVLMLMIPGGVIGLTCTYFLAGWTEKILRTVAQFNFTLGFSSGTIIVGWTCAILMPLFSLASTLAATVQEQLRDALDVFRRKADALKVEFFKIETEYGLSFDQIIMGTTLAVFGFISFVFVPHALLLMDIPETLFWNCVIFVFLVVGMIGIAQLSLPLLASALVRFYGRLHRIVCCSRNVIKVEPLVLKNLHAHRSRNTKTGVMMLVTAMFIVFVNSFSKQMTD